MASRLRSVPNTTTAPARMREVDKAVRAFKLRCEGKDLDAIATELGYRNRSGAHKAVARGCALLPHEELGTFKAEMDATYRAMLAGIYQRATHGDTWAIDRAVSIMHEWKALWGADAPLKRILEVVPGELVDEEIAWLEEERRSIPPEERPPLELPPGMEAIDVDGAPVPEPVPTEVAE